MPAIRIELALVSKGLLVAILLKTINGKGIFVFYAISATLITYD